MPSSDLTSPGDGVTTQVAVVLYCGGAIESPLAPTAVGYRSVHAVSTILHVLRHFGLKSSTADESTSFDIFWQHPESDDRPPMPPHVELDEDVKLCGFDLNPF